ncbi:RraA family protein [Priestia megaterium]|jgi:regulator of RNase E activity RraA|uniref:RraA family protein n=1 Tax=Priestia megaterium TaxID=1404 RepID=UPI00227F2927|nr:RraA family protein [Priestia megaterium]MCY9020991.1 RraA family protein [Priestia megaterium]MCY9025504.1 RraA family protein [Priestia megaterium]MED3933286.1 RraA family protein [Priestia megaterium]
MLNEQLPLSTANLSDAMEGANHLDFSIKPLQRHYKLFGPALTVDTPAGNNYSVLEAIRLAEPGSVLVIDGKSYCNRALAGDFVVAMAKLVGISGIVLDGVIRDQEDIEKLNFPVFCKGSTIAASSKKEKGIVNGTISCGGVKIHPGDFIAGDDGGVIVIPKEEAEEVLAKAREKWQKDKDRENEVLISKETVYTYLDKALK